MSALSPERLEAIIDGADGIIDLLGRGVEVGGQGRFNQSRRESVLDAYKWLHVASHDRKVGGESTALVCKKCRGQRWAGHWDDNEEWQLDRPFVVCESCTPTTGSDPTGETIVARETVLRSLDKIGGKATAALEAVKDMVSELQRIVGNIDRGVDTEPPNERAIPRTATKREVAKAEQANQRRQERGEGYGAG